MEELLFVLDTLNVRMLGVFVTSTISSLRSPGQRQAGGRVK